MQDRDGARPLLEPLAFRYGWLKKIWTDGDYAGALEREVAQLPRHRQIDLKIVKRSDKAKGFEILLRRWIMKRTFSWLIQSRRLMRDREVRMDHSKALIHLSMARRMLARIAT